MIEHKNNDRRGKLLRILTASVSLSVLIVAGALFVSEAAAQEQTNDSTQTNTNTSGTNTNTNTASPTNTNTASPTNTNTVTSGTNTNTVTSGTNTNTGSSANTNTVGGVNIDSHDVSTPQKRNPVNSATAAALTSSNDTCMGSTSAGGQAIGFGFSVGSTWTDAHCQTLKSSRLLFNMGLKDAAIARLCLDPNMALALNQSETPCPGHAKPWKNPDSGKG